MSFLNTSVNCQHFHDLWMFLEYCCSAMHKNTGFESFSESQQMQPDVLTCCLEESDLIGSLFVRWPPWRSSFRFNLCNFSLFHKNPPNKNIFATHYHQWFQIQRNQSAGRPTSTCTHKKTNFERIKTDSYRPRTSSMTRWSALRNHKRM